MLIYSKKKTRQKKMNTNTKTWRNHSLQKLISPVISIPNAPRTTFIQLWRKNQVIKTADFHIYQPPFQWAPMKLMMGHRIYIANSRQGHPSHLLWKQLVINRQGYLIILAKNQSRQIEEVRKYLMLRMREGCTWSDRHTLAFKQIIPGNPIIWDRCHQTFRAPQGLVKTWRHAQ